MYVCEWRIYVWREECMSVKGEYMCVREECMYVKGECKCVRVEIYVCERRM